MKTVIKAIEDAKEKLGYYRQAHGGNYLGGVEYTTLIQSLDAAIAKLTSNERPQPIERVEVVSNGAFVKIGMISHANAVRSIYPGVKNTDMGDYIVQCASPGEAFKEIPQDGVIRPVQHMMINVFKR